MTPKPTLFISMLDPPGGEATLEAPGTHRREDHGLQASGGPAWTVARERTYAIGWGARLGRRAGRLREP